jgi:glycosyltransferase involved in cell wall biosynthesis
MNKKIKVFHVLHDLTTGGAEKLVVDMCLFINKNEIDASIISLFPAKNNVFEKLASENGINLIFLNKKLGFDLGIIFALYKLIKIQKPDLIHTHSYVFPYVFPALVMNKVKARVHTVHNIASKEFSYAIRKVIQIAYMFFNVTPVAISDHVKKSIEIEYNIKSGIIPCIYNGIDTNRFTRTQKKSSGIVTFIHVGRFSKQKNHNLLVEAFAEALKKNNNIVLKLIGDGELKQDITSKVDDLGIKDKIVFKGITKDVNSELNSSDVFILSSDWEGLPLSVLEAMACGLPIISTKAGGTPDIVKNLDNGILVDIGDKEGIENAILTLAGNKKLREDMGMKSFIYSKNYDIRATCSNYVSLYKKLLISP